MSASSSTLLRVGPITEPANAQNVSLCWQKIFLCLHAGLMIPYITDAVPAFYSLGLFPLRPALFMLALCFLNAAWISSKGPDFTITSLFLIAFLALRAVDIGVLQRYLFEDGQAEPLSSTIALTLMAAIMAASLGIIRKISPLPVLLVAGSSLVIQAASVLLEFAGFLEMSTVEGRAAGLAGDANDSCMMMTLMLGVFLTLNRNFWLNLSLIAVASIGILPTLSRGGMLSLTLITATFCLLNLRQHGGKLLLAVAISIPLAAIFVSILSGNVNSGGRVDENARKRIEAIFGGEMDHLQSGERLKDLQDGLEAAATRPLTGFGTGAGQFLFQPHNQIVTLWLDLGLLGPLFFLLILATAAFKVLCARGSGVYILLPLLLYVGLAQSLLENYAYHYALIVLLFFTSSRFYTFRLTRPRVAV